MAVAKVTLNENTLIDVTQKTVDAASMLSGKTALNKAGNDITGSIASKSSSDLTVSGATVTAPAGYYSANASKAVSSMTLPTSASSTSSGTSKATIGRSTSAQYINIPTGYNGSAAYYTVSATPNGTATAPTSISGTAATVSTGTNTLTLSKTVSVTPSVTTAGYVSAGTAGNSSVSLTANVTTKAAATITPGISNQTIAAGTYLTGAQTIAGDSNLVSENIKNGVSIFGVSGSLVSDPTLQEKTAFSSTTENEITADTGYDGLSKVTIKPYKLQTKTVTPSSSQQIITPDVVLTSIYPVNITQLSSNPLTTIGGMDMSFITIGKEYLIDARFRARYNYRSSGSDIIAIYAPWTASASDVDIPFTIETSEDDVHPTRITFSSTQMKIYYPDGTTISRGSISAVSAGFIFNFKDMDASYDGLSSVTVLAI